MTRKDNAYKTPNNTMNLLKRKKKLPPFNGSLKVTEIYPKEKNLNTALGITTERHLELVEAMDSMFKSKNDLTGILEDMSLLCKHPNELVYVGMITMKRHLVDSNPFFALGFLSK
jgi:hypothetical protein